jgi:low temperature requirement protein LtrA
VGELHAELEQRVTPLELFFDLVFVFALTQVTTVLSDNPTWSGLGHGLLILGVLWWAWAAYAWLTNTVDPRVGAVWGAMLAAMAAMFVAALAVPDAFGSQGVLFGVAFLIVNVMHLTLYALSARGDPDLLAAILRVVPSALVGAALIVVAGFVGGGLKPTLWLAALAVGYLEPLFVGVRGWRVQPAHFVERHGLIVIIPIRAQQLLADRSGVERTALARDVYTYLHLPMVAGIVLFAFAMKKTLAHVGDELETIPAFGLCGGPALYLFAYVALRVRVSRTLGRGRLTAAIACALLWPVAVVVPAIFALTLVAIVWVGLHAYELIWWRQARAQTRALQVPAS